MIPFHDVLRVLYFFIPAYLANMSPIFVRHSFSALALPIDGGRCFRGKRLLGDHKTWRGLLAGTIAGGFAFELQRLLDAAGFAHALRLIDYSAHPLLPGLLMGLGAGVGDAVKSFLKRRLDIPPGASWLVFDQVDFFIGAYLFASIVYQPPLLPSLASLPLIFLGTLAATAFGYWTGQKESWI